MSETMPNRRTLKAIKAVSSDQARKDAREKIAASARKVMAKRRPLAALGGLDDLEMMEAATELTRKK